MACNYEEGLLALRQLFQIYREALTPRSLTAAGPEQTSEVKAVNRHSES